MSAEMSAEDWMRAQIDAYKAADEPGQPTCTVLDCTECGAKAGQPCEPWCIADQATPDGLDVERGDYATWAGTR